MAYLDLTRFVSDKPIRDTTYELLKDAIISGSILPGERIVESLYAKRLNVSRTPVREALKKLEEEGLVECLPHKGVVVKSLSESDINEIYAIRKALESLVIKQAVQYVSENDIKYLRELCTMIDGYLEADDLELAGRYGRAIHVSICRISRMYRVLAISVTLDDYMDRFSIIGMNDAERRHSISTEHKQIVEALAAKDLPLLEILCEKHLEGARAACTFAYEKMRTSSEQKSIAKNKPT